MQSNRFSGDVMNLSYLLNPSIDDFNEEAKEQGELTMQSNKFSGDAMNLSYLLNPSIDDFNEDAKEQGELTMQIGYKTPIKQYDAHARTWLVHENKQATQAHST